MSDVMSKKIGILTFSRAYNFGATLQCLALYKSISALGYKVDVIDYRPSYLVTTKPRLSLRMFICRNPLNLLKRLFSFLRERKRFTAYEKFCMKNLSFSTVSYTHDELEKSIQNYDVVVVGSDQVWCNLWNGGDSAWFALNGSCRKIRWITYAASAGDATFSRNEIKQLENSLKFFSAISTREEKLNNIVKTMGFNSCVVLDPTLLADPKIWERWTSPIYNDPYVVVYQARMSDYSFVTALDLAKQLGIRKVIPLDFYPNSNKYGLHVPIVSPADFIAIIANAKCVVTSSFHGTAFSIILKVPFYTIMLGDGADERSLNLLEKFNLNDRAIRIGDSPIFSKPDFAKMTEAYTLLREQSMSYLEKSI